jgi:polysaccharide biosynthesis/export protein
MLRAVTAVLGVVLALGGCASLGGGGRTGEFIPAVAAAAPPAPVVIPDDHKLGPYDKVAINVFRQPELSLSSTMVDPKGQIVLPLLGPVDVAGKTRDELTAYLTKELSRDLVRPIVTVTILEAKAEQVTLAGAVKKPGTYTVNGTASLLQLVTVGGGPDASADLRNVLVLRTSNRTQAKFDLAAISRGRAPDPPILPGDTIYVENSRVKSMWSQVISSIPVMGMFTAF